MNQRVSVGARECIAGTMLVLTYVHPTIQEQSKNKINEHEDTLDQKEGIVCISYILS